MNQESRATLEIIAPTVEEAIEKGLNELNLQRDQVDVEILDEGSKGLFGFGNRQVRIRLTLKGDEKQAAPPEPTPEFNEPASKPETETVHDEAETVEDESVDDETVDAASVDDELENVRAIAQATVAELLEKMDIHHAAVESSILFPEDDQDRAPGILVEILGDDLSILIGKRAETLNALQYVTRLIVGKEIGQGVNLTVDVEGYRSRREKNLRSLARRMAGQAVKTGRKQMLEPMPANERRIIHIELRDNDEVTTESVGDEPRRKITIIPNNR
ncbi:MAG TPA: RNA-binding cell elongation regulator Jag/EloR [Anaerolineales bacterium]|nr:RNA-binding cell elongation regulator Jag/EloR [Anaerolineales bacterium]